MKKLSKIFIFTLLCGASKGFMKALISIQLSEMNGSLRVKIFQDSVNNKIKNEKL